MRTLVTTLTLLLFASQAHAVVNSYDANGRLIGVSDITLSDGMTYNASIIYDGTINGATSPSGLSGLLNDEAAGIISSANQPTSITESYAIDFGNAVQTGVATDNFASDATIFGFSDDSFGAVPLFLDTGDSSLSPRAGGGLNGYIVFDKVDGDPNPVIPEPITATLIPLAVAPLLLRRRREA